MPKHDVWPRIMALPESVVAAKWHTVFTEKMKKVLHPDLPSPCWECQYATTQSGYCQINLNGEEAYGNLQGNYTVHLLAMRVFKQGPPAGLKDPDCSHLCHNKRCCNHEHLCWEEGRNNQRRNICPHRIKDLLACPWMHAAPPCLCPHSRFERDGVRVFPGYQVD